MYISKCVTLYILFIIYFVLFEGTPMVTFLVGKKIFEHLVLFLSLSDIVSSRYCTKYANDKQFIYYQCDYHKKAASSGHLSAGDEGAIVVPASAEVVESVSVWVVVVGPVGGVGIGKMSIDQRDHRLGCLGLLGITLLHGLLLSLDS